MMSASAALPRLNASYGYATGAAQTVAWITQREASHYEARPAPADELQERPFAPVSGPI